MGQQFYSCPIKAFLDQDYVVIMHPGAYWGATTFQCPCEIQVTSRFPLKNVILTISSTPSLQFLHHCRKTGCVQSFKVQPDAS